MSESLKKWSFVIQSSINRDAATNAGSMLKNTVDKVASQLGHIGSTVGVTAGAAASGVQAKGLEDPNILQLQGFLKSNYKFNIQESGKLDKLTVNALRKLEKDFNNRSGDRRFTGLFVIPEQGYVINYNDFLEAGRRIAKY